MAWLTVFKFSLNCAKWTMRCKLGAKDHSRSSLIPQERYFVAVVAALLLLFAPGTSAQSPMTVYDAAQLNALQSLFEAWNRTPDIENNLAGWNTEDPFPCARNMLSSVYYPNFRGVQCLTNILREPSSATKDLYNYSAFIIGLTLSNASIAGELPSAIGNITTLSTLELTGNPRLTGQLPSQLQDTNLYILDVHDNDFYGNPPSLGNLTWLLKLDLSGNRFNGSFPTDQIRPMIFLETLSLGSNQFEGEIPPNVFENMKQLNHLDLSNNLFTGSVPTLNTNPNLQVLDLSYNNFIGLLPDLTNITSLQFVDLSNNLLTRSSITILTTNLNWQVLDLSQNNFTGSLPDLTKISSLQSVNLSGNAFTGSFSLSSIFNSSLSNSLSILDLSNNLLRGSLNEWDVSQLGSLIDLYLHNNDIDGTLDIGQLAAHGFLQMKSNSASGSLKTLLLMNNRITNVLHAGIDVLDISTTIRLQGNPYCNSLGDYTDAQRFFCPIPLSVLVAKANRNVVIISTVTSVTSAILLLTIGFGTLLYRNQRYKRHLLLQVQRKFEEFDVKPTIFTYNELCTATRDFHPDMKLGQGGYGAVYKGVLANGSVVAVKQLIAQSTQSSDDFLNEIVLITGMRHRNLVNLKGCCLRERQKILVYEYVDNYDIDQILLVDSNTIVVDWRARMKICLGVARGLHYLHALAQPRIIHRDIKASNVLLDKNFEAKIADFGLALLFPDNQSHIMTVHVAGTKGYLAPEYALFGQLSDKVDVYSFGVLCLEVVSGRRNMDEKLPIDEMYLSKWAWKLHRTGNLMQLVDSTLVVQDDQKLEVTRLINIALLCIQDNEEHRPTMARVVAMLQGDTESEIVVVNDEVEDQYKDSANLLQAFGRIGLDTVNEGLEPWFVTSSTHEINSLEQNNSILINPMIELGQVRRR